MLLPADPKAEFLSFAPQVRAAIERVLTSGHYILGPEVEAFESEFSRYLGGGQVLGVANGTEAIELALRAAGVGPGDRVATVANTVTATVSAIEQIGARPVFVEIDPATLVMSLPALQAILAGTVVKAVIPVHLYGHPADMPGIMALCRAAGVVVIEDCARLLLCANMMDSLLRRRHGHRTHADVATRHLLLLHDGVILLRGNLLNLRGRYAGLGHGLLDRLIQLVKLLHF